MVGWGQNLSMLFTIIQSDSKLGVEIWNMQAFNTASVKSPEYQNNTVVAS